jgi:2-iminobutanoate/2-iminopropanoate deaminase
MANVNSYSYQVPEEREFGYAQALEVGNTIYVSGQLSIDENGNFLYPDDFEAQLKQLYANFDKMLEHFDATRAQVVSETQYVVDLRQHSAAMAAANLAYFRGHRPTSTTVGVHSLLFPGQLIEITFVIDTRLHPLVRRY